MKRVTLWIWSRINSAPEEVLGRRVGPFGIHRVRLVLFNGVEIEGRAYAVSHLPTGHQLACFSTAKSASAFVAQLRRPGWSSKSWRFGDEAAGTRKPLPRYASSARAEFMRAVKAYASFIVTPDWKVP